MYLSPGILSSMLWADTACILYFIGFSAYFSCPFGSFWFLLVISDTVLFPNLDLLSSSSRTVFTTSFLILNVSPPSLFPPPKFPAVPIPTLLFLSNSKISLRISSFTSLIIFSFHSFTFSNTSFPVWKIWEEFETFLENKQISKLRKKPSWRPNYN